MRIPAPAHRSAKQGTAAAPAARPGVNDAIAKENAEQYRHYGIQRDWSDLAGYFARLERQGIGINLASYVGATTVREMVVGYGDRAATADELKQMQLTGDRRGQADGGSPGASAARRWICADGEIGR